MNQRLKKLKKCFENIDESTRILVEPLINDAVDWEEKLTYYRLKLSQIDISKQNKEKYSFLSKLIRESEQQYTNVIKILVSVLRKNTVEGDDEFDKFLKEYTK